MNTYVLETLQTLGVVFISTLLAYLVGVPLGVILNVTSKNGIRPNKIVNTILGLIINVLRSIPCLIIIVIALPLTRAVFGRGTGAWYVLIIPLFLSSFAYVARVVEQSLSEVDNGVIEAARSMGANNFQIITKVLLKESRSSLIMGLAVTLISIIGYTSFAYDFAGGGLISRIYQIYRYHPTDYLKQGSFWAVLILVVVIVQLIQQSGLLIAKKLDRRN
ncbi:MAG: ABC transporter permease [Acholeplasmatales bacterium]|nr:ABC transporter permease [Acholeplasmatales bacterium]